MGFLRFIKKLCCASRRNHRNVKIIIKESEHQEIGHQYSFEELKHGYTYLML
jgi:hypothetical protein